MPEREMAQPVCKRAIGVVEVLRVVQFVEPAIKVGKRVPSKDGSSCSSSETSATIGICCAASWAPWTR